MEFRCTFVYDNLEDCDNNAHQEPTLSIKSQYNKNFPSDTQHCSEASKGILRGHGVGNHIVLDYSALVKGSVVSITPGHHYFSHSKRRQIILFNSWVTRLPLVRSESLTSVSETNTLIISLFMQPALMLIMLNFSFAKIFYRDNVFHISCF